MDSAGVCLPVFTCCFQSGWVIDWQLGSPLQLHTLQTAPVGPQLTVSSGTELIYRPHGQSAHFLNCEKWQTNRQWQWGWSTAAAVFRAVVPPPNNENAWVLSSTQSLSLLKSDTWSWWLSITQSIPPGNERTEHPDIDGESSRSGPRLSPALQGGAFVRCIIHIFCDDLECNIWQ